MKPILYSGVTFFLGCLLVLSGSKVYAQCGTVPGSGLTTISAANTIVNSYYPGTGNHALGTFSVTVGTINPLGNATAIAAGDLILIMQMQGADIDTSNTNKYGKGSAGAPVSGYLASNLAVGYYEYANVVSVAGSTINLTYSLANSYYTRAFASTTSIQSYQVIRIPRYYDLTINASSSITATPWNGSSGGVVVIEAADILTFANNTSVITVAGKGFRGGGGKDLTGVTAGNTNGVTKITRNDYRFNSPVTVAANKTGGSKGEGIAGTPVYIPNIGASTTTTGTLEGYINGSLGWGAPGNAGGGGTDGDSSQNQYNPGGGGGGNIGAGGKGGAGWDGTGGNPNTYPTGGYGGSAFTQYTLSRVIMGGGGGAGTANNSTAANEYFTSGASGGGIIICRAKSYSGAGKLVADGSAATDVTIGGQTDAAGGGGAGGTIIVLTTTGSTGINNLTASAAGGNGGNMTTYYSHGPGGGGGGGLIYSNGALASTNVAGGIHGNTHTCCAIGNPLTDIYGSVSGSNGIVNTLPGPPTFYNHANPASPCGTLPILLTQFNAVLDNSHRALLNWQVEQSFNFRNFIVEYSMDGLNFTTVGTVPYVPGVGAYSFMQPIKAGIVHYFRLRLVDNSSQFTYSRILTLRFEVLNASVKLSIFPNPTAASATMILKADNNQPAVVSVYDETGKHLLDKTLTIKSGTNYISLPESGNLLPGIYMLNITIDGTRLSSKLIKL